MTRLGMSGCCSTGFANQYAAIGAWESQLTSPMMAPAARPGSSRR